MSERAKALAESMFAHMVCERFHIREAVETADHLESLVGAFRYAAQDVLRSSIREAEAATRVACDAKAFLGSRHLLGAIAELDPSWCGGRDPKVAIEVLERLERGGDFVEGHLPRIVRNGSGADGAVDLAMPLGELGDRDVDAATATRTLDAQHLNAAHVDSNEVHGSSPSVVGVGFVRTATSPVGDGHLPSTDKEETL